MFHVCRLYQYQALSGKLKSEALSGKETQDYIGTFKEIFIKFYVLVAQWKRLLPLDLRRSCVQAPFVKIG
jgi:hypothetical protein